jgi:hypothetical protein
MALKAKFARKYRAKTGKWAGKTVRTYIVTASTDEELQQYEDISQYQPDTDTGKPTFKTTDLTLPSVLTLEWNYDGTGVYVEDKMSTHLETESAYMHKRARAFGMSTTLLHQALAAEWARSSFATEPIQSVQATVPQQAESSAVTPQQETVAEGETPFTDESSE